MRLLHCRPLCVTSERDLLFVTAILVILIIIKFPFIILFGNSLCVCGNCDINTTTNGANIKQQPSPQTDDKKELVFVCPLQTVWKKRLLSCKWPLCLNYLSYQLIAFQLAKRVFFLSLVGKQKATISTVAVTVTVWNHHFQGQITEWATWQAPIKKSHEFTVSQWIPQIRWLSSNKHHNFAACRSNKSSIITGPSVSLLRLLNIAKELLGQSNLKPVRSTILIK